MLWLQVTKHSISTDSVCLEVILSHITNNPTAAPGLANSVVPQYY